MLLVALVALTRPLAVGAQPDEEQPETRALIVYDTNSHADDNAPHVTAVQLQQLLGHFPVPADLVGLSKYRPSSMGDYDYCFLLGIDREVDVPTNFLDDARVYEGRLFWINYGVDQLGAHFLAAHGLQFQGTDLASAFSQIDYNGVALKKADRQICAVRVTDSARCRVHAVARSARGTLPYVTSSGRFWYIADDPFSFVGASDRYWAFADLLHDFLGLDHEHHLRALLRIEDVNPTYGARPLRRIADELSSLEVPYAVSLIPRYENPRTHTEITIGRDQAFGRAVRYMAAHGASIVMHGWNHRYHGVTADDFEFWDRDQGKPIAHDEVIGKRYVDDHLRAGIEACVAAGVYPVAWETPHYAASDRDYSEIARFFSTAVEQRMAMERPAFCQYFPFIIETDVHGQRLIPENLGYVRMQRKGSREDVDAEDAQVEAILQSARDARVVRDATVGAFFHPFLNPRLCDKLVTGLKSLGYTFIDLRAEPATVQTDRVFIATGTAFTRMHLRDQFLHEFYLAPDGRTEEETYSPQRESGVFPRSVEVPDGWIYVCRAEPQPPASRWTEWRHEAVAWLREHAPKHTTAPVEQPAQALMLSDPGARGDLLADQDSFAQAFLAMGMAADRLPVPSLRRDALPTRYNLLLVPQAAAARLDASQAAFLADRVRQGLSVVLDGYSLLSAELGVGRRVASSSVAGVTDVEGFLRLKWRRSETAALPALPKGARPAYRDFAGHTVGATWKVGRGTCLFLATLFDPDTTYGYARYPTLPWVVAQHFPVRAPRVAKDTDVYFEPGDREAVDVDRLVAQWKRWGVRAVHAAMWHFYPSHEGYDYGKLIDTCHANGIAVYAWFELPYVTRGFYDAHPEWREKTATGVDAATDWRLPMAMEIPACRRAVLRFVTDVMNHYDWDGTNIAELCFDCQQGPHIPDYFVPMHPYLRAQFRQRYGWDPVELVNPRSRYYHARNAGAWAQFKAYRAEVLATIYEDLLTALEPFARGNGRTGRREVIVTVYDTVSLPEMQDHTGADAMQVLGMMADSKAPASLADGRRFLFTLDVEDSDQMWDDSPDRYEDIGHTYAGWVTDPSRLMLNLNVVKFREPEDRLFATNMPVGLETLEMVQSARSVASRVIVYSESSLPLQDAELLSAASGGVGTCKLERGAWETDNPGTAFLRGHDYGEDSVTVDGVPSAVDPEGGIAVPAGEHSVQARPDLVRRLTREVPRLRLLNATAPVRSLREGAGSLELEYDALSPCLVTVDQQPLRLQLDGKPVDPEVWRGADCWTVRCPAGRHTAAIRTEDSLRLRAEVFSAVSSSGIVTFGGLGSLLLLSLLAVTKRRQGQARRRREAQG